tara:strand:- start:653 stop:1375 length:723 start_codon:yes stop_codon:yes gene_type:complete
MGFGGKSGFNNAMGMQEAAKKAAEKAAKEKDFFDKSAKQKADMRTADGEYDYSRTGLAGNAGPSYSPQSSSPMLDQYAANSSANKAGAPSGDINQIMAGRRRSAPPVAETAPVMREELGNAIAPMNYDDPANRVYADSMGAAMAQQASPAQQAAQQVVQGPQAAPVEQTSSIMEAADGLRQATPAQARSNEAFNPMKLANEKKASQLPNKAGGGKFGGAAPRSNINQPFQSGKGQNKGSS